MPKQKFGDLEKVITIQCKEHDEFQMTTRNHIGENEEGIAYGCPECCGFIEGVHLNPKSIAWNFKDGKTPSDG
jgi:hypothetical protein|tara:strand:+ start:418 stop:636 length:219 start_codon:yes stop_codon:yes gene_type:complete